MVWGLTFNRSENKGVLSFFPEIDSLFTPLSPVGASSFDQGLTNWNVSKVTDARYMFADAYSFNGDLSNWQFSLSSLTYLTGMFQSK